MNPITATVDTQVSSYSSIGSVNALDDVKLTLEVLTNGVIDTPWTSPTFELIGVKSDKNEVRQTDGFEVLDISTRKVKIKLKEQFLTCSGMLKLQLIIKDSGRTSSTVFYLYCGQSLEQDLISIRDVEVFDQLDLYVAQGFNAINEATEITGELKKEMTEINNEASQFEKERQASELTRNQRELVRVDNEEDRVANEIERVDNENERIINEEERVANENTRITNENNRRTHENTRISQEAARQEAERQRNAIFEENENIRNEQENTRIKIESERKKKFTTWEERETVRLKSEENRILQERERVSNEEERKRHESTRQEQENYRQRTYTQFNEAEASRVNNEIQRETSEKRRQQAEKDRDTAYQSREDNRDVEYGKAEEVRNAAFEQNEANRQNEYTVAERDRVESEELRKGRERERANAETKRQEAETARANAESGRVERFNQEVEKAKNTMDTATSNVNNAISEANDTMQDIEQRAEDCLPIIEKSASAKLDYMGNEHESIKDAMDSNVEFVLDEVNTVHYEGQTITATDTIERQVRSAILKGQTLVNLIQIPTESNRGNELVWDRGGGGNPSVTYVDKGVMLTNQQDGSNVFQYLDISMFKPSTTYTLIIDVEHNGIGEAPRLDSIINGNIPLSNGHNKFTFTTKDDLVTSSTNFRLGHAGTVLNGCSYTFKNIIVIEGDYTNVDIPYFTGMSSVKMPVLKTTGKNLFDYKSYTNGEGLVQIENGFRVTSWAYKKPFKNFLKPNTWYQSSYLYNIIRPSVGATDDGGGKLTIGNGSEYILITGIKGANFSFRTPENIETYYELLFYADGGGGSDVGEVEITNIQIEEGSTATSYEHYKSNILSVPIENHKGFNGVYDTVDCITGEVVERIKECMVDCDGYQVGGYLELSNTVRGYILKSDIGMTDFISPTEQYDTICDKFSTNDSVFNDTVDTEGVFVGYNAIYFKILKTRLLNVSQAGFTQWFRDNPTLVAWVSPKTVIKTVDLNNQKVYSYDGTTHYTCSSAEGSLVPTLSIDVPTNLPALVSRQRVTIESQKEQIITLEQENEQLIAQNEVQDTDIALNQDAINFILFAPSVRSISEDKGEVNAMAAYLANQILKGKLSYELVVGRYAEFKEDIDTILILEGKQDLIK